MTLETLNDLANRTPDSKETIPGEILFFRKNSSLGESLKKLKNHNFKIGYSFTINIEDREYTKIIAYNKKNDIFSGWLGYINDAGQLKEVFPIVKDSFPCYLNMPRIDNTGKLKLYREKMSSPARQTSYARKMFDNLPNLEKVNDISLYGTYWPVLENPNVETYKRNNLSENRETYSDVAALCNIYKFDETYELLDEGLKEIYKKLIENKEKLFCIEYKQQYANREVIQKTLEYLNLSENDVKELFVKNDIAYPKKNIEKQESDFSIIKAIKKTPFYQKKRKFYIK